MAIVRHGSRLPGPPHAARHRRRPMSKRRARSGAPTPANVRALSRRRGGVCGRRSWPGRHHPAQTRQRTHEVGSRAEALVGGRIPAGGGRCLALRGPGGAQRLGARAQPSRRAIGLGSACRRDARACGANQRPFTRSGSACFHQRRLGATLRGATEHHGAGHGTARARARVAPGRGQAMGRADRRGGRPPGERGDGPGWRTAVGRGKDPGRGAAPSRTARHGNRTRSAAAPQKANPQRTNAQTFGRALPGRRHRPLRPRMVRALPARRSARETAACTAEPPRP
jgi:hypothetical protein